MKQRTGTVIGICGRKRAGKDTVAGMIVEHNPRFFRFAFADPMKQMALAIDPMIEIEGAEKKLLGWIGVDHHAAYRRLSELIELMGWDGAKEIDDCRRFLQRLGTEGGRNVLGQDVWVDRTFGRDVIPILNAGHSAVLTDVRFTNEIKAIQLYGGKLWRVERPGQAEDVSSSGKHSSEHEWRAVKPDKLIVNDGNLAQLHTRVLEALRMSGHSMLRSENAGAEATT